MLFVFQIGGELPVEVGGSRLPRLAKCSAAKVATADAPTVVKSFGMSEAQPSGFAKYNASVSDSQLVELMEKVERRVRATHLFE